MTPEGYALLTHQLMTLAAGRVIIILEVSATQNHCHSVADSHAKFYVQLLDFTRCNGVLIGKHESETWL